MRERAAARGTAEQEKSEASAVMERLSWQLACRDDQRVAQALYAGEEIEELHELSEAGLLDEFFVFLEQVGMMAIIFVLMLFVHDHPYAVLEPFHEGEHLTPGFLFRSRARPYGDVFVLHGLGVDGGIDALALGDPPSPRRVRRLQTLLDAATLALLVPIAAELSTTAVGAAAAVFVGLCMIAAGQIPLFPWFRLAPLLLAALGMLRYVRWRSLSSLALAFVASTLGVLWSLDTGLYALAATVIVCFFLRARTALAVAVVALLLPFALLLIVHADIHRFLVDSFVIIPRSIDAIWSRPALREISWESARYYLPPVFFGWMVVVA